jgi:hypothetical protein
MIRFNRPWRAAMALGAIVLATAAAPPDRGELTAVSRLEPGLWQLRDLDDARVKHPPICVGDPAVLMQLEHRDSPCSRLVIASDGKSATVHYTCPAGGFGRTSLRVETPRLAQIDTQGISDKIPFAYRIEARRVGACDGRNAKAAR